MTDDPLAPARGICLGCVLSVPIWAAIAAAAYAVIRVLGR